MNRNKLILIIGILVLVVVVLGVGSYWQRRNEPIQRETRKGNTPPEAIQIPAEAGGTTTIEESGPAPVATSSRPTPPKTDAVTLQANGIEGWIKQTNNVIISWTSSAKECTLSLGDQTYVVGGSGSKDFKLKFASDQDTKHYDFNISCSINGKLAEDNVTVGGLVQ